MTFSAFSKRVRDDVIALFDSKSNAELGFKVSIVVLAMTLVILALGVSAH